MRRHSPRPVALPARPQEDIAAPAAPRAARPARDVVRFAFAGPNRVVAGGRITGMVDWGPLPGDRTVDLASLLSDDGDHADVAATRARAGGRALQLGDAAAFGVYLARLVHRQTDWPHRHHDAAVVERVLGIGAAVFRDLDRRRRRPQLRPRAGPIPSVRARPALNGLLRDWAAVRAALTEPWSSGQVEGQVNRLKVLKRQMYGRANVDLLRKRVLYRGHVDADLH